MKIKEININKFPVVIFSDSHTNLVNIKVLKKLYPESLLLSLGDFTNLFEKGEQIFNKNSINYFIENKINALLGNHESYITDVETGNSFLSGKVLGQYGDYNLKQKQLKFLQNLPVGFKLNLPNDKHYLCYHNTAHDLWGFNHNIPTNELSKHFNINKDTLGVIHGHFHKSLESQYLFKPEYIPFTLYSIANLSGKSPEYLLLTENGIEYHKI